MDIFKCANISRIALRLSLTHSLITELLKTNLICLVSLAWQSNHRGKKNVHIWNSSAFVYVQAFLAALPLRPFSSYSKSYRTSGQQDLSGFRKVVLLRMCVKIALNLNFGFCNYRFYLSYSNLSNPFCSASLSFFSSWNNLHICLVYTYILLSFFASFEFGLTVHSERFTYVYTRGQHNALYGCGYTFG